MNPSNLIRSKRKITGMSAILLPFLPDGQIDFDSFDSHLKRTLDSGLIPAVNMDTGYGNLLEESVKQQILDRTASICNGSSFVAGAFVADQPGAAFDLAAYQNQVELIQQAGGLPILFQSYGLAHQSDQEVLQNYQSIAKECDRFLAFELGTMFAPFGKIYSLDLYKQLIQIPQCTGAKHSSLQRMEEWQRIEIRNEVRPEFMVLTGNDLAIDMVMYGSDYLLGISTFCPDLFAKRDQMWLEGDSGFYQLNDVLQYLGFFAFRNPTSGYKHNAAMFLNQRGWIQSDLTHPKSVHRPESDRAILEEIGKHLGLEMAK